MKVNLLALACLTLTLSLGSSKSTPLSEHPRIQRMYQAASEQRGRSGLPAQVLDEELCKQAQRWANNMAARNMMYHGGGEQVVAHGYSTPEACIRGWIYSPGHRVWVLGRQGRCGFGCQKGSNGRWYYAGVFR